ncbi:MAG: glutathione S-transferase N-terminal domain-containing protein, partial [Alphaproteobacteria bacterium]
MKLRYNPASPYVRKVTVTLIETGLEDRVERIPTNPHDPETDIATVNPLGKVPTLITDDGEVLVDSPVICEYLDSLHDGAKLFPA